MNSSAFLVIMSWVFALAYAFWDSMGRPGAASAAKALRGNESPLVALREWFKALGFIVASIAAVFAYRQLDVAKERALNDQRPWVSMIRSDLAVDEIKLEEDWLQWTLHFKLKNSGLTPAQHVAVGFVPVAGHFTFEAARERACSEAETTDEAETIFPHDESQWNVGYLMSQKEFADFREEIAAGRLAPLLIVCIAYRSAATERFYHTPDVISMIWKLNESSSQAFTGKAYHISTDRVGDAD